MFLRVPGHAENGESRWFPVAPAFDHAFFTLLSWRALRLGTQRRHDFLPILKKLAGRHLPGVGMDHYFRPESPGEKLDRRSTASSGRELFARSESAASAAAAVA